MTFKEIEPMFQDLGIFYKYDEIMKLWLIFLDDITVYVDPREIEYLTMEEFRLYFGKLILQQSILSPEDEEITIH
jgi:hypothetical protein